MAWSLGLAKTLGDRTTHVISSPVAVVIQDKYPKAQSHYLVLPKESIPSIFNLKPGHLPLLEELHLLAVNTLQVKGQQFEDFKMGFHAAPSMQQLHLHVISKDFVSDCLKTKKHWNSFNTPLFIPYDDLYRELKTNGCIKRLESGEVKRLAAAELACNQCAFIAKNIPALKEHLLEHLAARGNCLAK